MPELRPVAIKERPEDAQTPSARKRLFVGLALGASCLLCLLLLIGWMVPLIGLANIHPYLPYVSGILFSGCIAAILFGTLCLVAHVRTGKPVCGSGRFRGWATRFFLPLMELMGRVGGISSREIRQSFIKVNNELVNANMAHYAPEDVLVLLPHCIQRVECEVRLSYQIDRCRRCGLCPVGGLMDLRDRYAVKLAVATGGSIARRIVVEQRPRFILAVACERDLSSGIQDTYPLPVFGLLNERPQGPCYNTRVSLPQVEAALRRFIHPDRLPKAF